MTIQSKENAFKNYSHLSERTEWLWRFVISVTQESNTHHIPIRSLEVSYSRWRDA
jgi:hypothetical protein